MMRLAGLPSAKTVLLASFLSWEPSKLSSADFSSANVWHFAAISIAEPKPSVAKGARLVGLICASGGFGRRTGAGGEAGDAAAAGGRALNRSTGTSPTDSSAPASTSQFNAAKDSSREAVMRR